MKTENLVESTSMFTISVNEHAPVIERQQIIVPAAPQKVWQALTEINQWPTWQKGVKSAQVHGSVAEGTSFEWKAGGLSLRSKIHTCKPVQYFGWTGNAIGTFAIHNWKILPHENGTLVEVEESLDGVLPKLFSNKFSTMLRSGMRENLKELKARALAL